MIKRASNIRELAKVRADNREILNRLVDAQGTALGRKNFTSDGTPDGDPCIIVYVPHKIHSDLILNGNEVPKMLVSNDGLLEAPTDVVVTTSPRHLAPPPPLSKFNQELVDSLQWMNNKLNFFGPGVQIGAETDFDGPYEGTLGYIVRSKKSGHVGILTNQHIGQKAGQSIYFPSVRRKEMRIGITRKVLEHVPDDLWMSNVDEMFAYIRTDASFIVAEDRVISLLRNEIPGVGPLNPEVFGVDFDSMDIIGTKVKKVGRTTGLQKGTIVAVGYGVPGDHESRDRSLGFEPANIYTDLLIAPLEEGNVFSAPGDSGSPIVIDSDDENNNRPIGLLWGGWPSDIDRNRGVEDLTYGIALDKLLTVMNLELI